MKPCPARRSHAARGDGVRPGGQAVIEDRFADFCAFGDVPDFRNAGVQHGHPLKGIAGHAVPLQIADIGDLVNEGCRQS